jgi:hypothetical protein
VLLSSSMPMPVLLLESVLWCCCVDAGVVVGISAGVVVSSESSSEV